MESFMKEAARAARIAEAYDVIISAKADLKEKRSCIEWTSKKLEEVIERIEDEGGEGSVCEPLLEDLELIVDEALDEALREFDMATSGEYRYVDEEELEERWERHEA